MAELWRARGRRDAIAASISGERWQNSGRAESSPAPLRGWDHCKAGAKAEEEQGGRKKKGQMSLSISESARLSHLAQPVHRDVFATRLAFPGTNSYGLGPYIDWQLPSPRCGRHRGVQFPLQHGPKQHLYVDVDWSPRSPPPLPEPLPCPPSICSTMLRATCAAWSMPLRKSATRSNGSQAPTRLPVPMCVSRGACLENFPFPQASPLTQNRA